MSFFIYTMRNALSAGIFLLTLLAGAVFLYSAYTKLFPIQSFEYTMVEFGHLSWSAAAIMARIIIGIEATLGLLLLTGIYGRRKWVVWAALLLTLGFSGYLVYLWSTAGNKVNCGCFGDAIWMSPSASLVKNGILILVLLALLRYGKTRHFRGSALVPPVAALASLVMLFTLFPLPDSQPSWLKTDRYELNMSALYAPDKPDRPQVDLRQGKHIIAFFTLTCPHCRVAAHKLYVMKQRNPTLPIYMVLAGPDEYKQAFFEDTKATNIPYSRLRGQAFVDLAGLEYPAIYWVENGWVTAKANYITLSQEAVERWLQKP